MMNKKNVLFLHPGIIYDPESPSFADNYTMLSEHFNGVILTTSDIKKHEICQLGSFTFRALITSDRTFWNKLKFIYFIITEAIRYHKKNPFDVIVAFEPMYTGFIGIFLQKFLRIKLIVEINSEYYYGATASFYGKNFKSYLKSFLHQFASNASLYCADAIRVLSADGENKLPARFKKKNIYIIPSFVPTHYFSDAHDIHDNYILFVGYPFRLKGIENLIRAFANISANHPDFKLLLIGHEIEKDARNFFDKLPERIEFLPGLYYDEVRKYMEKCYCFVLPSKTEGYGRVVVEAMSCGKPVIVTNVGGLASLVQEGKNGFIVVPGDIDQLANRLNILLENPDLAMKMGQYGRTLAMKKFSSDVFRDLFIKMINACLLPKL